MSRVVVTHDDGLATLRLTRAHAGNAIDPEWVADFGEAVGACAGARAVLICADGPAFTVGGDLKHLAARLDDLDQALREMVPDYHRGLKALAALPAPVVAAVQGPIAGGGLGVALCADIVLITPDTRFVAGFAALGLSGDGGGSWFLPRLVGPRLAAEMLMLNRALGADEAVARGLATRVVALEELEAEGHRIARSLADGPTVALAHMRRLLRESWTASLQQQLDAETAAMIACGGRADAREGVDAFASRRAPEFSGE
ncbi:MAG TPA: enoyl-CoA hydratase-related protein [Solirubrobacteraceae bacterium]|nr:enoyl-CoA hydratase-related protein [Solirubrobacteraceae bacterium]